MRVAGARQCHETGAPGVLLTDLLQQLERLGRDPDLARGQEAIELGHAERVGANRGEPSVLALLAAPRAPRQRSRQGGERLEQRRLVTGREHERRVLVHGRELEYRRRRRPAIRERRDAAPRSPTDPAVELLLDQPP